MTALDAHLHRLFLDHDCVVVPGLGGFVCNRRPAQYDELRQELVPPARGILFNERLVHHDGVLAQAVARAEGITMDEAVARITEEAAHYRSAIAAGKTVSIAHVGRLYAGANQRIQFLADEEMERMLESFGLRRIALRPIAQVQHGDSRLVAKRAGGKVSGGKVLPLPVSEGPAVPFARIAAAIAVPVIGGMGMFLLDSWNGEDARMGPLSVVAVTSEFLPRIEGEGVPTWTDVEALNEPVETAEDLPTSAEEVTVIPVDVPAADAQPKGLFMLVAGAFSVESNATALSESLQENGFDSEVYLQDGGLHIVTYATHLDEQSAREHLAVLKGQTISKNAWLKPWKVTR